jgi:hypothetical protein
MCSVARDHRHRLGFFVGQKSSAKKLRSGDDGSPLPAAVDRRANRELFYCAGTPPFSRGGD